ncbi:MAG: pirin family protein [Flavobacteriales bacterium]|nr:pirin family protein [Flavobacteriales bacterium]MBT3677645.1 pirin family protein [Flavobacteriales bacterium]MBT3740264.1 pirin family protein [Flavobacteriales bacterium]MBT4102338.1 pirin family protein [Flavobacteriales bacterium]MBT4201861.1 pirin family protein [Flavobacteriales bacterium]
MNTRSIKQIIPAKLVDMGGHLLDQPLPANEIRQIDPFLLIHHWNHPLKGGQKQADVGVGPHPHRGFSPVTFVFKGTAHHRDSLGNDAIVGPGGTQWMHAGKGITHSERPGKNLVEHGGDNEFIQFWVNSPAKHKMEPPYYHPLSDEDTPKVSKGQATIAVVAGEFDGIKGPMKTYSPQTLLRGEAPAGALFTLDLPQSFNALIYLLNGSLVVDGNKAKDKDMVWFNNDGESIHIEVTEASRFIVLSGEPINEPVASYGPIVMNTQSEIMDALQDIQSNGMGILKEAFD